jgi:hypothetical protein
MHIPDDPQAWSQGAAAFKSIFDGLRTRSDSQPSQKEGELIDAALDKANKATAIAEAEVAKALGFELCKCEFPPVPMLTVGTHSGRAGKNGAVYECPKFKFNTASPFTFTRLPGK